MSYIVNLQTYPLWVCMGMDEADIDVAANVEQRSLFPHWETACCFSAVTNSKKVWK